MYFLSVSLSLFLSVSLSLFLSLLGLVPLEVDKSSEKTAGTVTALKTKLRSVICFIFSSNPYSSVAVKCIKRFCPAFWLLITYISVVHYSRGTFLLYKRQKNYITKKKWRKKKIIPARKRWTSISFIKQPLLLCQV